MFKKHIGETLFKLFRDTNLYIFIYEKKRLNYITNNMIYVYIYIEINHKIYFNIRERLGGGSASKMHCPVEEQN